MRRFILALALGTGVGLSVFQLGSQFTYDIDRPRDAEREAIFDPGKPGSSGQQAGALNESPLLRNCPAEADYPPNLPKDARSRSEVPSEQPRTAEQAGQVFLPNHMNCSDPLSETNTSDSPRYPNGHQSRGSTSASGGNTLGGGVAGIAGGGASGAAGGGGSATTGGMTHPRK